jgi:hypothetical protein
MTGTCFDGCFGTSVLPIYGNFTMAMVRTCAARRRYTLHALQSKAVSASGTYSRPFTHGKRPPRQRLSSNGDTGNYFRCDPGGGLVYWWREPLRALTP